MVSTVSQVTEVECYDGNVDSVTWNSQGPSFPARPVKQSLCLHLGKAEPGLSPVLVPLRGDHPLHEAGFDNGGHTDYLGDLRHLWELSNATDGSASSQAERQEF